jgi:hypothetical protein
MPVSIGSELQDLPLEAMIGGPMQAAIKAQALSAQTTVEFINSVGLEEYPIGTGNLRARTVDFRYVRSLEDPDYPGVFNEYPTSLTVPLLTIVPIPYIRISDMNITFEFKISNTQLSTTEQKFNVGVEGKVSGFFYSVKINASYTYQKLEREQTDRSATLKITVNAVQDAIPEGLARVLSLLQDAIIGRPA